MPFDMNQLFDNPSFQFGASLLGNARQPGAMNGAFGLANQVNQFKEQKARNAQAANYENSQINQMAAKTAFENSQNQRLDRQSQLEFAQKARAMAMQENVMKALAGRFGMDPTLFATPPGSMTGQLPPEQGATPPQPGLQQAGMQQANAMDAPIPGSNLHTSPLGTFPGDSSNGLTNNVDIYRMPNPGPGASQMPSPIPGYNTDSPRDNSGPSYEHGGRNTHGNPELAPRQRLLQRTTGQVMAPAILGQESGNRDNVGTSVNGAVGPGQMLPQTFQRFARPGESITNPQDNRNVSTRYLDYLASKAAGDPAKIAAGYFSGEGNMGTGTQPFKRDVADGNGKRVSSYVNDILNRLGPNAPTGYTQRILAGLDQPPAQQSGMQGPPSNPQDQELAQIGAMMSLAGMHGGDAMMKLAELQKPQNVPAGSYQRDPSTGQTTFMGDPYREQSLRNDQSRIGIEQQNAGINAQRAQNDTLTTGMNLQKGAREITKQDQDLARAKAGDINHLNSISTNMDRMGNAASELLKDPGLKYNTGMWGALHVNAIPGTAGRDARARFETLKNKLVVDTMTALKEASATGSTGFGQLSEKEGERLETMVANLDSAQSEDALRKQLQNIVQYSHDSKMMARGRFNNIYGIPQQGQQGAQGGQQQQAPAAPAKAQFLGFE